MTAPERVSSLARSAFNAFLRRCVTAGALAGGGRSLATPLRLVVGPAFVFGSPGSGHDRRGCVEDVGRIPWVPFARFPTAQRVHEPTLWCTDERTRNVWRIRSTCRSTMAAGCPPLGFGWVGPPCVAFGWSCRVNVDGGDHDPPGSLHGDQPGAEGRWHAAHSVHLRRVFGESADSLVPGAEGHEELRGCHAPCAGPRGCPLVLGCVRHSGQHHRSG